MRERILISGQVQGVGFRPFVWRLATALGLTGFCRNTTQGVEIEIQGPASALARFERRLVSGAPPLARIERIKKDEISEVGDASAFAILPSSSGAADSPLISPDVAICDACLAEIRDPADRRFGYPFANCTDCGPRFSIIRDLPYDRAATAMACFAMCQACGSEYVDPADRRFHAQPVACPDCGPAIWFVTREDALAGRTEANAKNMENALERAARAIQAGRIIAIRGLGGFQLVCDARNRDAVMELRKRKLRPHKALAIMIPDLAAAESLCAISPAQAGLLSGKRKPIVICRARSGIDLAAWISPDTPDLGLMLPYTPLHALLFDRLAVYADARPILVMTSANPAGEPICLGNRESLAKLAPLADAWLLHDRDILSRVDDSVIGTGPQGPFPIRRSRGYVPEPVRVAQGLPVFAAGADLKAAFCLAAGEHAYVGQHIGDLHNALVMEFYEEACLRFQSLLGIRPDLVACDLHPDFESSRFAERYASEQGLPLARIQHHLAHALSCMAENGHDAPALALCLDGSGLGTDGTIWGGELLLVDPGKAKWERQGSLANFILPGGEAAIRQPWRIAAGLKFALGAELADRDRTIAAMIQRNFNCPRTTSAGRLFDAVAALLGLCDAISYEGQAAMRLEAVALKAKDPIESDFGSGLMQEAGHLELDSSLLFRNCVERMDSGLPVEEIAALFHHELASGLSHMAALTAEASGVRSIALSGGAMQNALLSRLLVENLAQHGLRPLMHRLLPPGDGGLSLGQVVWARRLFQAGKI